VLAGSARHASLRWFERTCFRVAGSVPRTKDPHAVVLGVSFALMKCRDHGVTAPAWAGTTARFQMSASLERNC